LNWLFGIQLVKQLTKNTFFFRSRKDFPGFFLHRLALTAERRQPPCCLRHGDLPRSRPESVV
jgi:hypothetical protein